MIYKYELACREAGLSEEQTAEIRRFFDAEKKKLKRRNQAIERYGITYFSINHIYDNTQTDGVDFDITDASVDVEADVLHEMDLERLRELMDELAPEDREFLEISFAEKRGAEGACDGAAGYYTQESTVLEEQAPEGVTEQVF